MDKVAVIQDIYQAFGQGRVADIAARVANESVWDFNGGDPSLVPWHEPVQGVAGVPGFMQNLMSNVEITTFEPMEFVSSGNNVIAHIHISYKVLKTGKRVDEEQLHWWQVNDEGKVTRLRHFEDTAQVIAANRA
jgi:uncharacterized protein